MANGFAPVARKIKAKYGYVAYNHPYSRREFMSEDSHKRRMAGLFKTWAVSQCKAHGEPTPKPARVKLREKFAVVAVENRKRHKKRLSLKFRERLMVYKDIKKRVRLKLTVAKEAREIQEIARQHTLAAIRRLGEIVQSPVSQDTAAIQAAAVLLDRAYGKATQTNVNANLDANGKATEVSAKELDTRITEALKRVEAITGRAPEAPKGEEQPADVCVDDRHPGGSTLH